jgi:hypothetical protein
MNQNKHSMNSAWVSRPIRDHGIGRQPAEGRGASPSRAQRNLRQMAREAIDAGELPRRRPDRMWGGRGTGDLCSVCGVAVRREEAEIELEFDGNAQHALHVHVPCLAAWELELDQVETGTPASRTA